MNMNKRQLYIAGGGVLLVLLYLYYRSRQASAAAPTDTTGTTADQTGSDYATLAGGLQGAPAQEQGDIAQLGSELQAAQAQETADTSALAQELANATIPQTIVNQITQKTTPAQMKKLQKELAQTMAGEKRLRADLKAAKGKTGVKKSKTPANAGAHRNANHPAGTAGQAVGSRHHAPPRGHRRRRRNVNA